MPPRRSSALRSTTSERTPRSASACASAQPARPAPTMTTSCVARRCVVARATSPPRGRGDARRRPRREARREAAARDVALAVAARRPLDREAGARAGRRERLRAALQVATVAPGAASRAIALNRRGSHIAGLRAGAKPSRKKASTSATSCGSHAVDGAEREQQLDARRRRTRCRCRLQVSGGQRRASSAASGASDGIARDRRERRPRRRRLLDRDEVEAAAARRVVAPRRPGREEVVAEPEAGLEDDEATRCRASARRARRRRGRRGAPAPARPSAGGRRRRARPIAACRRRRRRSAPATIGAVFIGGAGSRRGARAEPGEQPIANAVEAAIGEHRRRHAGDRVVQPARGVGARHRVGERNAVDVDREDRLPLPAIGMKVWRSLRKDAIAASASASALAPAARPLGAAARRMLVQARIGADRPDEAFPAFVAGDEPRQRCARGDAACRCRRPARGPRRSARPILSSGAQRDGRQTASHGIVARRAVDDGEVFLEREREQGARPTLRGGSARARRRSPRRRRRSARRRRAPSRAAAPRSASCRRPSRRRRKRPGTSAPPRRRSRAGPARLVDGGSSTAAPGRRSCRAPPSSRAGGGRRVRSASAALRPARRGAVPAACGTAR